MSIIGKYLGSQVNYSKLAGGLVVGGVIAAYAYQNPGVAAGLAQTVQGVARECMNRLRHPVGVLVSSAISMAVGYAFRGTQQKVQVQRRTKIVVQEPPSDKDEFRMIQVAHNRYFGKDYEGAVKLFSEVLKTKPDHAIAMAFLAKSYQKLNNMKEAARWAREALAHPNLGRDWRENLLNILADNFVSLDQPQRARRYRKAAEGVKGSEKVFLQQISEKNRILKLPINEREAAFRSLLVRDPDNLYATYGLAELLTESNPDEAFQLANDVLALHEEPGARRFNALTIIGDCHCYSDSGNFSKARLYYTLALNEANSWNVPDDLIRKVYQKRAVAAFREGRLDEAYEDLEKAIGKPGCRYFETFRQFFKFILEANPESLEARYILEGIAEPAEPSDKTQSKLSALLLEAERDLNTDPEKAFLLAQRVLEKGRENVNQRLEALEICSTSWHIRAHAAEGEQAKKFRVLGDFFAGLSRAYL